MPRITMVAGGYLKRIFVDTQGRLRNGVWILIFIVLFLLSRVAYTPLSQALQSAGIDKQWLGPLQVVFVLLVTWACTRLRREPLSSVGLRMDGRWTRQALAGTVLGMAAMLLVAALVAGLGGVRFALDPARAIGTLAFGFYMFVFVAAFEELLFRGFVFQRLIDGFGAPIALAATGILFALGHGDNPGMEGATQLWAMGDIALGALVFGLAYLRTGSLALPVGLHLGWNWMQGHVLGFAVSGIDQPGWLQPLHAGAPQWLTGGEFGPESSICAVVVDLLTIALLWCWKGTRVPQAVSGRRLPGSGPCPSAT